LGRNRKQNFSINFDCTENALSEVENDDDTRSKQITAGSLLYILAYLVDNPDAGDTFEGIVEWWLLHQRIKIQTRTVSEAAAAKLVDQGLIVAEEGSDSRVIYRINRDANNFQNIQTMLRQIRTSLDD
jgi:hypothetical protein